MITSKLVNVVGIPYLYGKDCEEITNAPDIIRKSGLFQALEIGKISYKDLGNLKIGNSNTSKEQLDPKFLHLSMILEIINQLKMIVSVSLAEGKIPVVLGGDHSVAIGSLLGQASYSSETSVIWIDTHGDFHNSLTTPSGRLHGMALALGLGLDEKFNTFLQKQEFINKKNVVLFGAHKFDQGEKESINQNITLIDLNYINRFGIGAAVEEVLKKIHTKNIHISLDLDSIDKQYAPGSDMAIEGALTYRELFYVLECLSTSHNVVGIDVVEYNPQNDVKEKTASLAIEAITTLLGNRIGAYEMYMEALDKVDK